MELDMEAIISMLRLDNDPSKKQFKSNITSSWQ